MMMIFRDLQKKPFTSLRLLILFVIKLCECHLNRFDLFDVTISSIRSRAFLLNYSKKASRHSFGGYYFGRNDFWEQRSIRDSCSVFYSFLLEAHRHKKQYTRSQFGGFFYIYIYFKGKPVAVIATWKALCFDLVWPNPQVLFFFFLVCGGIFHCSQKKTTLDVFLSCFEKVYRGKNCPLVNWGGPMPFTTSPKCHWKWKCLDYKGKRFGHSVKALAFSVVTWRQHDTHYSRWPKVK